MHYIPDTTKEIIAHSQGSHSTKASGEDREDGEKKTAYQSQKVD